MFNSEVGFWEPNESSPAIASDNSIPRAPGEGAYLRRFRPLTFWRALAQWLTVENLRSAADLLLKTMGIFVALAALNFLKGRPDLRVTNVTCHVSLSTAEVAARYESAGRDEPPVVRAILPTLSGPVSGRFRAPGTVVVAFEAPGVPAPPSRCAPPGGAALTTYPSGSGFDASNSISLPGHPDLGISNTVALTTGVPLAKSKRAVITEVYGSPARRVVPLFVWKLAYAKGLDSDALRFALQAIKAVRSSVTMVSVANFGSATAEGVTVFPPAGFRAAGQEESRFLLAPGPVRRLVFVSSSHFTQPRPSDFIPTFEGTSGLNTRLLVLILLPTVALLILGPIRRDVWSKYESSAEL